MMSKTQYSNEEKLQMYIDSHQSIIDTYNSIEGVIPLDYSIDDVISMHNKLKKIRSCDFIETFKTAINHSIKYEISIIDSYDAIIAGKLLESSSENNIQQYFKEINDIYSRNDNNYDIEYCPENRDRLIEMNLKQVISIAKKYQGLGLDLEDLIGAGNLGLTVAYDKFNPSRSKLKDNVLQSIEPLNNEVTYEELVSVIKNYFTYGDVKHKFDNYFKPDQIYKKSSIIKWVNNNIYNAKFSSVAAMWIKAYILIELDTNSRLVKKPKSEIVKDKEQYGSYKKEVTLDIDAPVGEDGDTSLSDILYIEDDTRSDLDTAEAYDAFKNGLKLLLTDVKSRDRSIFLKKFGIGYPRPLLPREIAEQEGLSIARVSQVFQNVIEQMQKNQAKYNVNPDILFEAVKKLY